MERDERHLLTGAEDKDKDGEFERNSESRALLFMCDADADKAAVMVLGSRAEMVWNELGLVL
jgi:hypothetical protein